MFSEQYEHIQEIQRERKGDSERTKNDLNNALKNLSEDIYGNDAHFIFELLQNADDNSYQTDNPSVSFKLIQKDPTFTSGSYGALVIENNECGFAQIDVDSLCRVGESLKRTSSNNAFIGEKGIGFKSVFRVTNKPHIFSNGYQFCLPANKNDGSIGMVVPDWIENFPKIVNHSLTTIILPLDRSDFKYDVVKEILLGFDPDCILFLNKLKMICIEIEGETSLILTKEIIDGQRIRITQERYDNRNKTTSVKSFLLYNKTFNKPNEILAEKRKNCLESKIALAFPLDIEFNVAGKIFAYLPVKQMPNVPFFLNADFLLTSSREDIHVDEPWNKWLVSCVSDVFVEAFDTFLDDNDYSELLYKFIPLKTDDVFIKPAIASILNALKDMDIILTEPDGQKVKPSEAYFISNKLRSLLFETTLPKSLQKNRVVLESLELYKKQLTKLGVKDYSDEFIQECFREVEWLQQHDFNWLLRCYHFFVSNKIDVSECPIIPVDTDDGLQWCSKEEEAIYSPCNEELKSFINDIPDFIHIDLRFLSADFFNEIQQETETCRWIEDTLGIQTLNEKLITEISLDWVNDHFESMSDEEIIKASLYFSENLGSLLISRNIPIILFNGEKKLLSRVKSQPGLQAIVPPMALDPETGWQNIFTTYEERDNLEILSDYYVTFAKTNDTSDSITHFFQNIG
ncbi:MAG: hypothetical protein PHR06_13025, partial [Candidatus Cloacimonetes bacterium]|nr:hypothetical protein [Candidatus Cloacimonadota bacterium]